MDESILGGCREPVVGTEKLLAVLDLVEGVVVGVGFSEGPKSVVHGVSLNRFPTRRANKPAQPSRTEELTVTGSGGSGNTLIDEGAAEVVAARGQQQVSQFFALFHPRGLDVSKGATQ